MPLAWTRRRAAEVTELLDGTSPITPVFQPVVALASGHLVGYEALSRFSDSPKRSPEAWFAQAHGCGLGPDLEAAAIRAAFEPMGRPLGTHLAVNVSPSALTSAPVVRALPSDLNGIVIEITEHEFVSDDDDLVAALAELRERGALIAIDDAGAGYAGLTQAMRVRPDIVKLDRNLTKAIHSDPARMVLVESFVRFARRTGAIVCAEGIESLDDLAVLGDLDVQWGQGYALARPAAPWALVSPVAAEVCRASLAQALRASPVGSGRIAAGDRRLEHLSARLASARSGKDLEGALALIGEELQADTVCLSRWLPDGQVVETRRRERRDPRGALPDRRVPADRPGAARAAGRTGAGRRPGGRPTGGRAASLAGAPLAVDGPGGEPGQDDGHRRGLQRGRAAVDQDPDQSRADHLEPVRLDDAGGLPARAERAVDLGRLAEEHLLKQEEVEGDDQRRQYTDER